MENCKNPSYKCHLFLTSKSTTINQRSFRGKFCTHDSASLSNTRRSKYTTNSKLTKSSLFKSLTGLNVIKQQQILAQLNLQIQLLQGSYISISHLNNNVKKQLSNTFRDLTNTLDELMDSQNR